MANVVVENLARNFGGFQALKGISFTVNNGEFVTLLGPSGCGKSTTLAALAGLDRPTDGRITIGDRVMFDGAKDIFVDAQYRNLGLMFQSYALWPHMTVFKNLDFPLELRRIRGKEARRRIEDALDLVEMSAFAERFPGELSGGQQQRVALARTLVYRPEILLLDEPLSNLDAKLRERARIWLSDLHRSTGMTTVYVTHDQSEALAMSDKIIVMDNGVIAQAGSPKDVYERPATPFVADFVGAANLLKATVENDQGVAKVRLKDGPLLAFAQQGTVAHGPVTLGIRPERIRIANGNDTENVFAATVVANSYLGARNILVAEVGSQQIRVETDVQVDKPDVKLIIPNEAVFIYGVP